MCLDTSNLNFSGSAIHGNMLDLAVRECDPYSYNGQCKDRMYMDSFFDDGIMF